MMSETFIHKLRTAQEQADTWLCIGLDPIPDQMPPGVDLLSFNQEIIQATAAFACAYKLNLPFYLTYGPAGLQALQDSIAAVPETIPTILDAKFGDIEYVAMQYAKAAFEVLNVDAVTISPYVGMDAVKPLLTYARKGVFVLVRSSNTSGNDFQLWPSDNAPLFRYVTAQLNTLAQEYPEQIGLGVAATQPRDLARLRCWAPNLPFLIPGIGVQQGDLDIAVEHGTSRTGIGPVISISRSIIYASSGRDFAQAAHQAAHEWVDRIHTVRSKHPAAYGS